MNKKYLKLSKVATKSRITITVDAVVYDAIESKRGLIPRSIYINEKLREAVCPAGGK